MLYCKVAADLTLNKMNRRIITLNAVSLLVFILLSGCQTAARADPEIQVGPTESLTVAANPTATPQPVEVVQPTKTLTPQSTPTAEPLTGFPAELHCGETFCQAEWLGLLARPIGVNGRQTIDPTYPYASTKNGTLEVHHGVEFTNGSGTPVLAAQQGEVVFAGTDERLKLGPYPAFYGNVIILRHPRLYEGLDVYTLYAHLSVIEVSDGQQVDQGDLIGRVGATGAANGSHLHFEVRLGENAYSRTTNPLLWFAPLDQPDLGKTATLAGVIIARWGEPLEQFQLALEKIDSNGQVQAYFYPTTYARAGVDPHPDLNENFVIADLPPGNYRLAFISSSFYQVFFNLEAGSLGFVDLRLD